MIKMWKRKQFNRLFCPFINYLCIHWRHASQLKTNDLSITMVRTRTWNKDMTLQNAFKRTMCPKHSLLIILTPETNWCNCKNLINGSYFLCYFKSFYYMQSTSFSNQFMRNSEKTINSISFVLFIANRKCCPVLKIGYIWRLDSKNELYC